MKRSIISGAALALFTLVPLHAEPMYQLESAATLKSVAPDWDYVSVDPKTGYLFIGLRGEGVVVFDTHKGQVIQTVAQSDGANGVVLVPEFDRAYSANADGTTTVFQLSTLKTIARLKIGEDADAAFYDPVTKQIAFTMGDSKAIAFLDAKTGKFIGTLKMDSKKLDGTAANGEGQFLMALRDKNSVVKIDVESRQVVAEWKTTGCDEPTGLAYDQPNKRIFVGCRGKAPVLAVLNAENGAVVATLEP